MPRYVKDDRIKIENGTSIANINQNLNLNLPEDTINALANAVANAVGRNRMYMVDQAKIGTEVDITSGEKSLEKLAENMTVQRGSKDSNFNDLGNIKTTIKDQKELDSTIDALSQLDD